MQTCTQTITRYAADPAPERRFPLPGGTQTHGITFAAKAAALCAGMAALSCPGWKAEHPDWQHTQNPSHDSVAAEIACAVQELSFHKASEIYTSTTCKRSGDQSDCSGVSREIKKTHPDESECVLAGAVGLEPTTNGFGDRDSTN